MDSNVIQQWKLKWSIKMDFISLPCTTENGFVNLIRRG